MVKTYKKEQKENQVVGEREKERIFLILKLTFRRYTSIRYNFFRLYVVHDKILE